MVLCMVCMGLEIATYCILRRWMVCERLDYFFGLHKRARCFWCFRVGVFMRFCLKNLTTAGQKSKSYTTTYISRGSYIQNEQAFQSQPNHLLFFLRLHHPNRSKTAPRGPNLCEGVAEYKLELEHI